MVNRIVVALCFLAAASVACAQSPREVVQAGKAATAMVEMKGGKSASATCVHESGIFITNRHVVEGLGAGTLKLTLSPNEKNQQEVIAKLIRVEKTWDLAVLKSITEGNFPFLPIGDDTDLIETMNVTAFGFPFGKGLSVDDGLLPEISVNVGRITALRKREGKLQQIQLDAQLNPGNSGGPVLDEKGRVVGIVTAGVLATGVNFATPVRAVKEMLHRPEVVFTPPRITATTLYDKADFRIEVSHFLEQLPDVSIELQLTTEEGSPRTFTTSEGENNKYLIKAVPLIRPADAAVSRLVTKISFDRGRIDGVIEDCEFTVGETKLRLSEVTSISAKPQRQIVHVDGKTFEGEVAGLDDVPVLLGDYAIGVDLMRADSVTLQVIQTEIPTVEYAILVRSGKTEVQKLTGSLNHTSGNEFNSNFLKYTGEKQVIELPGVVSDVTLAKGGQLLLLQLNLAKKIAVYDVNQAKIVRYVALAADNMLMAAGRDKLILINPKENVLERWSLNTFKRELTATLPGGAIKGVALGYASNGPLLVHVGVPKNQGEKTNYQLLDLRSLEPLPILPLALHNTSVHESVHMRASANGNVFGLWATQHSPQGMECLQVLAGTVAVNYQHESAGHVVPNFDGTSILTGNAGVCTPALKFKPRNPGQTLPAFPSTLPGLYVTVPTSPGAQTNLGLEPYKGHVAAVRLIDSEVDLVPLPEVELGGTIRDDGSWTAHDFTLDKRVFFIPQADQLISVPYRNDQLIVQRFDLKSTLNSNQIDYLFVSSTPPPFFCEGECYRYKVVAESRQNDVELILASGPVGMQLSPTGELIWDVPAYFPEREINVYMMLRRPDGPHIKYSFKVIRDDER